MCYDVVRSPNHRFFGILFVVSTLLGNIASCQTATDEAGKFLYYSRGSNVELIYQKDEEDRESIDVYEFRENGQYATLQSQVVTQNGALVSPKSSDSNATISVSITPWPSSSTIQVIAKDLSQSFDASGAYQPIDRDIITKAAAKRFIDIDHELNSVYGEVIGKLKPFNVGPLREFQREWAKNRDDRAHGIVRFNYGELDSRDEQVEFELARTVDTLDRIKLLKEYPNAIDSPGITGTYSTNWDRTLWIDEQNGEVNFELTAFNQRNGSTGDLIGNAKLKANKIHWVDTQDTQSDPQNGQPAEVTITFAPNRVATVESKNDDSYHGVGIIFDGEYLRTSADRPKIDESQ